MQSSPDLHEGFPGGSDGQEPACNARDLGSIPRLGRSPGEGKGYPLQYSGLENSRDYTVHGVAKSQTQLSDLHFTFKQPNIFLAGMILKTKIKLKERKRDEKQEACILGYSLSPLVQFNHSVKPKSLRPLGLQYARLPCPSPTPGAYSNSCPLSR